MKNPSVIRREGFQALVTLAVNFAEAQKRNQSDNAIRTAANMCQNGTLVDPIDPEQKKLFAAALRWAETHECVSFEEAVEIVNNARR